MSARTLLAVPITRATPPLAEQVRAAQQAGADLIELRVDCIGDVDAVADLLARPHALPFILTVRSSAEGGAWDAGEAERIALIARLGLAQPGYVDVELAAWDRSASVRREIGLVAGSGGQAGPPSRLILSHHDPHGTPGDLDAVFDRVCATPADVVKVVFTARDATDGWRILAQLQHHSRGRPVIALAMGDAGLLTRILAARFGGFLTFAALEHGAESAPGQLTVRELIEHYRWRDIGPDTRVYGVVGWPVAHSRSPLVHNAAMSAEQIDGVYVPMPVAPDYRDFAAFMDYVAGRPELGIAGLSVTIPHKEHALRWLTERGFSISDLARRAGAVNTFTRTAPAAWAGDNTDIAGAIAALDAVLAADPDPLRDRQVAVLGAGGAARAVTVGVLDRGGRVTVFNRTPQRAQVLAHELRCAWKPWEQRVGTDADVVVNCTSVGMHPGEGASPLAPEVLQPGQVVFDAVYNPPQTRLLRDARRCGCRVVSGVDMFIGQAAAQFRLWHARCAPTATMRSALTPGERG